MLSTTHLLFSLLFGSFLFDYLHPSSFIGKILFAAFLLAGTFIPDLDSKLPFFKHRGIFHTIWPVIGILIAGFWLEKMRFLLLPFVVGYGSHLIADMITPFGVAPVFPLSKHRIRGPVKTGSFLELGIATAILAIILVRGI